jgi:hypothetical protein
MKMSSLRLTWIFLAWLSFPASSIADGWNIHQGNGFDVTFNVQQAGTELTGSAFYVLAGTQTVEGTVQGTIDGAHLDFNVTWTGGTTGNYAGNIEADGFVRNGTTVDLNNRASTAKWVSTTPVRIGTSGARGSKPILSITAALPAGFTFRGSSTRSTRPSGPPVKSVGRQTSSRASAGLPRSICDAARRARARNSPAAPNLEAQCLAAGGPKTPPGVLYTVTSNNDLLWYRHVGGFDGTFKWAFPDGKKVGIGWAFKQLFSGGDGVIYALTDDNDLLWYRHDGRGDGTFRWAFPDGKKVGIGWAVKQVFSGGDGVIYAITNNNDLLWYRHDGRNDGTFRWAFPDGKKVGTGWSFKHVFSGGHGVIYAITNDNDLLWYRHDGRNDGTFRWAFPDGKKVGTGWSVKQIFCDENGRPFSADAAR